jgi:hypothetical protein
MRMPDDYVISLVISSRVPLTRAFDHAPLLQQPRIKCPYLAHSHLTKVISLVRNFCTYIMMKPHDCNAGSKIGPTMMALFLIIPDLAKQCG